jgi:hypothetical protein
MKKNDDLSGDTLGQRLRREGMAERPEFSEEFHRRILDGIDGREVKRVVWPRWVAAAAVLMLCGWTVVRLLPAHRATVAVGPTEIVRVAPQPVVDVPAPRITVEFGGIVSGQLWPPRITVNSQISEPVAAPIQPRLGSPEWMLACFEEPERSAKAALADVVPGNMGALIGLDQARQ